MFNSNKKLAAANKATREAIERAELAEVEVGDVSGANGRLAAKLDEAEKALARTHLAREEAWTLATQRETETTKLAEELATALQTIERMNSAESWEQGVAS